MGKVCGDSIRAAGAAALPCMPGRYFSKAHIIFANKSIAIPLENRMNFTSKPLKEDD